MNGTLFNYREFNYFSKLYRLWKGTNAIASVFTTKILCNVHKNYISSQINLSIDVTRIK